MTEKILVSQHTPILLHTFLKWMQATKSTDAARFFIAGINYKKTDVTARGAFAINDLQYESILADAAVAGIHELFILSTCNRTEIYGFAENAGQLIQLLCSQTTGTKESFAASAYIKNGMDAIEHLFHVAAGLDSQILGDYEIVGQIKQAVKFSKQHNGISPFLERMVNAVLQSSKVIKNQTALSSGTVSVSFAAVQYIKRNIKNIPNKNILLVGIGKIGRNTCRNLVDYLGTNNITLINRSEEKAAALANAMNLRHATLDQLADQIRRSDIILVATNAAEPVILSSHLENSAEKFIIDLSIPFNVEVSARELPNIKLVDVDELSKLKDETLQKRQAEVPEAKRIIKEHIAEFIEWCEARKHVPTLKAVKTKLNEIHTSPLFSGYSGSTNGEEKIQRVINGMASKMRRENQRGCHYIEAINEFITAG